MLLLWIIYCIRRLFEPTSSMVVGPVAKELEKNGIILFSQSLIGNQVTTFSIFV